jgi:hypothetical protein
MEAFNQSNIFAINLLREKLKEIVDTIYKLEQAIPAIMIDDECKVTQKHHDIAVCHDLDIFLNVFPPHSDSINHKVVKGLSNTVYNRRYNTDKHNKLKQIVQQQNFDYRDIIQKITYVSRYNEMSDFLTREKGKDYVACQYKLHPQNWLRRFLISNYSLVQQLVFQHGHLIKPVVTTNLNKPAKFLLDNLEITKLVCLFASPYEDFEDMIMYNEIEGIRMLYSIDCLDG